MLFAAAIHTLALAGKRTIWSAQRGADVEDSNIGDCQNKLITKMNELNYYFRGKYNRQLHYTMLGYQKNLNVEASSDLLGNQTPPAGTSNESESLKDKNYVSYFLAFNHRRCRVEYFLINYGYPVSLKLRAEDKANANSFFFI